MNTIDGTKVREDMKAEYMTGLLDPEEFLLFDEAMLDAIQINAEAQLQELFGIDATREVTPLLLVVQASVEKLIEKGLWV